MRDDPRIFIGFIAALLCGGCGGGGDAAPAPPPPPPANRAPQVAALTVSANEEQAIGGRVTATDADGDAVTFAKSTDPAHGTLSAFATDGNFTYVPAKDYFGTDTFKVTATDAAGNVATGTVTLNVANVNDTPVAADDFLEVAPAATLTANVLENDADADGEGLTVTALDAFPVGSVSVNADRTVKVTPPAGFVGTIGVHYRVSDATGSSSDATAVLFVGVPAYRMLYSASDATGTTGLWLQDFASWRRIVTTPSGQPPERLVTTSKHGEVVAFQRGTGSSALEWQASNRVFIQRTAPGSPSVEVHAPAGLEFTPAQLFIETSILVSPLVLSSDGRWLAVAVRPAGVVSDTGATFVYLVDTTAPDTMVRVAPTYGFVWRPTFVEGTHELLVIASTQQLNGESEVLAVDADAPATVTRLSQPQAAGVYIQSIAPSRDGTRVITFGTQAGKPRITAISMSSPGVELMLADDITAGEVGRGSSLSTDDSLSFVAYGAAVPGVAGSSRVRRVSTSGAAPPVNVVLSAGPEIAALASTLTDDGRVVVRRTPGGGAASPGSILQEVQFTPTPGETTLESFPYANATYGLGGQRLLLSSTAGFTSGGSNPKVLVRGDYANPLSLPPITAAAPTMNATYALIYTRGTDGMPYLANVAAPTAWYLPGATAPAGLSQVTLVGSPRRAP